MKSSINEQQESYEKTKICCIWKKMFKQNYTKDKNYRKAKDFVIVSGKYREAAHSLCRLKCSITVSKRTWSKTWLSRRKY